MRNAFILCVIGYFVFFAVQGDRGLFSLARLQHQLMDAETRLTALRAERAELEHREVMLRPDSLDLDMLDEQVRYNLNYSADNEMTVFAAPQ